MRLLLLLSLLAFGCAVDLGGGYSVESVTLSKTDVEPGGTLTCTTDLRGGATMVSCAARSTVSYDWAGCTDATPDTSSPPAVVWSCPIKIKEGATEEAWKVNHISAFASDGEQRLIAYYAALDADDPGSVDFDVDAGVGGGGGQGGSAGSAGQGGTAGSGGVGGVQALGVIHAGVGGTSGELFDACDDDFIPVGANHHGMIGSFDSGSAGTSGEGHARLDGSAYAEIAKTGATAVKIAWGSPAIDTDDPNDCYGHPYYGDGNPCAEDKDERLLFSSWGFPLDGEGSLDVQITAAIDAGLIPIIAMYDGIGATSSTPLDNLATWLIHQDRQDWFNGTDDNGIPRSEYIILNPVVEPDMGDSAYDTAVTNMIDDLRGAGYEFPIMIDANGYGRDSASLVTYGAGWAADDAAASGNNANIILSWHPYSLLSQSAIATALTNLQNTGLPVVVSEFSLVDWNGSTGWSPPTLCGGNRLNYEDVADEASSRGIGWMPWAWGDDPDAHYWNADFELGCWEFDMTSAETCASMRDWGCDLLPKIDALSGTWASDPTTTNYSEYARDRCGNKTAITEPAACGDTCGGGGQGGTAGSAGQGGVGGTAGSAGQGGTAGTPTGAVFFQDTLETQSAPSNMHEWISERPYDSNQETNDYTDANRGNTRLYDDPIAEDEYINYGYGNFTTSGGNRIELGICGYGYCQSTGDNTIPAFTTHLKSGDPDSSDPADHAYFYVSHDTYIPTQVYTQGGSQDNQWLSFLDLHTCATSGGGWSCSDDSWGGGWGWMFLADSGPGYDPGRFFLRCNNASASTGCDSGLSTADYPAGQWFCFEAEVPVTQSQVGVIKSYIDGSLVLTKSGAQTFPGSGTPEDVGIYFKIYGEENGSSNILPNPVEIYRKNIQLTDYKTDCVRGTP